MLNLSLKQEEEYLQKTVVINEKYNKELDDATFWRQGIGKDRSNSAINKDIASSWNDYTAQLSAVESRKETIDLVSSYTGDTDKKKTPIVDPKAVAEALKIKKKELQEIRKAEDEMLKLVIDSRKNRRKR